MKIMYEMIRYHGRVYVKSSQYSMPLGILIVFLAFIYHIIPVFIIDSFTLSGAVVFYIMVWIGLSYHRLEPPVSQQIITLRLNKAWKYYVSDSIFLTLLGMAAGTICMLYPLMLNLIYRDQVFLRQILAADILAAWLIHCAAGFAGSAVGTFFHPRVMKDRKAAVIITALVALLAVVKAGMVSEMPGLKWLMWVFPPLAEVIAVFTGEPFYEIHAVLYAVCSLAIYGVILSVVRIGIQTHNKF